MPIGTGAKVVLGALAGFGAGMAVGAVEVDKKRRDLDTCRDSNERYRKSTERFVKAKRARLEAKGMGRWKYSLPDPGGDVNIAWPKGKRRKIEQLIEEHAKAGSSLATIKKALATAGGQFVPWLDGTPGWSGWPTKQK